MLFSLPGGSLLRLLTLADVTRSVYWCSGKDIDGNLFELVKPFLSHILQLALS